MREFKFRAWDKKSKKIREVESIGFGVISCIKDGYPVCNMIGKNCIEHQDVIVHRDSPDFILQQFTGLTDKNGVEIYDGDVVAFGEDDMTEPRLGMYGEIGVVKYSPYDAAFKVELSCSGRFVTLADHLLFSDRNTCRIVIGNIHENPELLGE